MPILFLKTGWMARYQGHTDDPIFSTMSYVVEHRKGHERNNFKIKNGKCFGYAPVSGVDIQKHFDAPPHAKYMDGIDVVWVSNRPKPLGGLVIVGWYRDARVFRNQQSAPGLIITQAEAKNCTLLAVENRVYGLPLEGNGSFRSAKIWYGHGFPGIIRDVEDMLLGKYKIKPGRISRRNYADPDIVRKAEVEAAAVAHVTMYYMKLGYDIESVESENSGWDLTAKGYEVILRLEVKGTAHEQIMPLLTPNEYAAAKKYKASFRICIVSGALTAPSLSILRYASEINGWIDDVGKKWEMVEAVAAQARPL